MALRENTCEVSSCSSPSACAASHSHPRLVCFLPFPLLPYALVRPATSKALHAGGSELSSLAVLSGRGSAQAPVPLKRLAIRSLQPRVPQPPLGSPPTLLPWSANRSACPQAKRPPSHLAQHHETQKMLASQKGHFTQVGGPRDLGFSVKCRSLGLNACARGRDTQSGRGNGRVFPPV